MRNFEFRAARAAIRASGTGRSAHLRQQESVHVSSFDRSHGAIRVTPSAPRRSAKQAVAGAGQSLGKERTQKPGQGRTQYGVLPPSIRRKSNCPASFDSDTYLFCGDLEAPIRSRRDFVR
jgi:hypothetical protein